MSGLVEIAPGIKVSADAEQNFWQARRALALVREWARARMVSPHALLVAVLQRVLVSVPPFVVLPPIVGDDASLNLFAGVTAPTAGGKDRALDVARRMVRVANGQPFAERPVGSGEGLVDLFAEWDAKNKRTVMIRQAVLLRASEVDALESLGKRVGSTLMVMLRLAYMGQVLGFTYRSNAATLEPHTYRLCLTVGVQPEHAKPLLGPEALSGGTAGRFLWAPATSLVVEPSRVRRPDPEVLRVELPPELTPRPLVEVTTDPHAPAVVEATDDRVVVRVCPEVEEAVLEHSVRQLRGEGEPMQGYDLLMAEKVGFALAVLDGRHEVAQQDWLLAGHVLAVSRATRDQVLRVLADAEQHSATGKAIIEGRAGRAAVRDDPVWQRARDAVLRHLRDDGPRYEWELAQKLSNFQRDHLGSVLAHLEDTGVVKVNAGGQYELTTIRDIASRA